MELIKGREKWIDNAKGIAILAVIAGHCGGGIQTLRGFDFVYGFHLVVFFLLSGYTFKKKEWNREYITSKFRRLMIPYFFTCLAILLTDVITTYFSLDIRGTVSITGIIAKDLVRSFFASGSITQFGTIELGSRIGAIWFLPAMFFAVLMFQLLLHYTDKSYKLGLITAGLAYAGYISARFIWLPFSIQSGMMATFFLWVGYEVKQRNLLQRIRWYHYLLALGLFVVGEFTDYANVSFVTAWCRDTFLSVVVGLAGSLVIYFLATLPLKGISYLGRISMTILCVHLYARETMGGGRILQWDFGPTATGRGASGMGITWNRSCFCSDRGNSD